ncbi:MAG TPA: adenine phosphoribosyltransferase [bacterium]|nr:adenine phosphoribosyltransferase [bacterium]HPN29430.1 adenine phosphoribosyltransferase [bacterium]
MKDLKDIIRDVENFPKQGIIFKDITPLLGDGKYFNKMIKMFIESVKDLKIDKVLGAEARGFIIAAPVAYKLKAGFIPARKPRKLPYKTISQSFNLEYGTDSFEIHTDAIKPGENILILDDVLATGGTAEALVKLVETLGGNVIGLRFLIELSFLKGLDKLQKYNVKSLIKY